MSEAIIKFKLPEEDSEFRHAIDGGFYAIILWDIIEELRSRQKYHNKESIDIDEFRDFIYNKCEEFNINLDFT